MLDRVTAALELIAKKMNPRIPTQHELDMAELDELKRLDTSKKG